MYDFKSKFSFRDGEETIPIDAISFKLKNGIIVKRSQSSADHNRHRRPHIVRGFRHVRKCKPIINHGS